MGNLKIPRCFLHDPCRKSYRRFPSAYSRSEIPVFPSRPPAFHHRPPSVPAVSAFPSRRSRRPHEPSLPPQVCLPLFSNRLQRHSDIYLNESFLPIYFSLLFIIYDPKFILSPIISLLRGECKKKTPVSPGHFPDLADAFLSHCPGIPGHQKMHLIGIEPLIYNPQPPINAVFLDHWC